jgi:protein-export membrane protein SecD
MLQYQAWKVVVVLGICLFGLVWALPSVYPTAVKTWLSQAIPVVPHRAITLGLDLQGGVYVLFEAEIEVAAKDKLQNLLDEVRKGLRKQGINYAGLAVQGDRLSVKILDAAKFDAARIYLRGLAQPAGAAFSGVGATDYEVQMSDDGMASLTITPAGLEQIRANAMAQSVETLRKRIDPDGTKEVTIQPQGGRRIIVQVPGETDPAKIIKAGSTAAKLTFHLVDESVSPGDIEMGRIPPGSKLLKETRGSGPSAQEYPIVIKERAVITGDMLEKARGEFSSETNLPVIAFTFNAQGARRFADLTRDNVGRRFAAVLDGKVVTAPNIIQPILGGTGVITGNFTIEEANETAVLLNSGALFVPLKAEEQRTVGAELGEDSIVAGQYSALGGLILVAGFMLFNYRLFGIFANVALVANLVILLGLMTMVGATLTLPGVAAFVLTMGMAVDANVLIYERIKEEVRNGKTLMAALDSGFERAMATIIDANATHALAGAILLMVGSGPVRGFAVAFFLGILTSFFTSIFVTRLQVVMWLRWAKPKTLAI